MEITRPISILFILFSLSIQALAQPGLRSPFYSAALKGPAASAFDQTSLSSWWQLNETSGTRSDSKGTNVLAVTGYVTNIAGVVGNAAGYDKTKTTSALDTTGGPTELNLTADWTLTCWFNVTNAAGSPCLYAHDGTGGNQMDVWIDNAANYYVKVAYWASTLTIWAASNTVSTNAWHFLCIWQDSSKYIQCSLDDGTIRSNNAVNYLQTSTATTRLGNRKDGSQPFAGHIDEFAIFKRALTAAERTYLYNAGSGRGFPP